MSHLRRSGPGVQEAESSQDPQRSPFADVAGRFASWLTGADRMLPEQLDLIGDGEDPLRELSAGPAHEPPPAPEEPVARFPVAAFGYNRAAVDEHLASLERELEELREKARPAMSITEELERIGEQTASILVVAHDKAQETTRIAQEQADRCIADAAASAVAMTEEAKQRLRELDSETDSVWRERERLLEDVRTVSVALATLADEASSRFPAAVEQPTTAMASPAVHAAFPPAQSGGAVFDRAAGPGLFNEPEEPQATEPFSPMDLDMEEDGAGAGDEPSPSGSGDTGSWLAGFEPPDYHYPT